jgi:hypothetical protein
MYGSGSHMYSGGSDMSEDSPLISRSSSMSISSQNSSTSDFGKLIELFANISSFFIIAKFYLSYRKLFTTI